MSSSTPKSITLNSIYYMVYNVLNTLFPFISGIYVTRVLLPADIGLVAYAQNIAQYFVILSFLGIPTYGMREIAKFRNDQQELNRIFTELYIINFISTLFFLATYIGLIVSIPSFRDSLGVYLIVGGGIALNALNISFLYDGLEEFKFTSIRNLVFKGMVFVLLVLLVKRPGDYLWYAALAVFGTAGNYIINMLYASRHAHFTFNGLKFRRHLRPILMLVMVNLAIEIYSLVDITMLGSLSTKTNVAFYSYGHRIQRVLLQIINSFTMVIVPRLSFYYKEQQMDDFNRLLNQTLFIILILACPMIVGLWFISTDCIRLLYGAIFLPSAGVLKILAILLLVSPVGYLLGSRILLVAGQEHKMMGCVTLGAVTNVIANWLLIPLYNEFGAAYASVLSELIVAGVYVWSGKKYFVLQKLRKQLAKIGLGLGGMMLVLLVWKFIRVALLIKVPLQVFLAATIYFVILLVSKEEIVSCYFSKLLKRLSINRVE